MTETQNTQTPALTFHERRRNAAAEAWAAQHVRDTLVGEIAVSRDNRRERWTNVIEIVPPAGDDDVDTSGAYVVEITPNGRRADTDPALYATVVNGVDDHIRFYTVDVALLHAIARRAGDASCGAAAHYAARVLGVTDQPA